MSRIAAALNTDDLMHHEQPCDSDTVRALGLTAMHRPLGVLIMEAKEAVTGESAHDAARIRDLIDAIQKVCRKQARIDRLLINCRAVAHLMAQELVLDKCRRCEGRGFLPLKYTPDQDIDERGVDCPVCFASGRARRDFAERAKAAGLPQYNDALKRFYEAMEGRLASAELSALDRYKARFWR